MPKNKKSNNKKSKSKDKQNDLNVLNKKLKRSKEKLKEKEKEKEINIQINSNNKNLKCLKHLIEDSYCDYYYDSFCVFKSINEIFYLIYAKKNRSIIFYDLKENKIIIEIKKAHKKYIKSFRHYLDKINKRDLLISITGSSCNIKLWNINNYECLANIKKINKISLKSACFLNDNNNIYIITNNSSCHDCSISEPIKIFDVNGNKVKEINDIKEETYYIDIYYDNQSDKKYIITANNGYSISYDYNQNKIYNKYCSNDNEKFKNNTIINHHCVIVSNTKEIVKLIESNSVDDDFIRIWNFHSGNLLNKIKIIEFPNCMYLWNNNYLLIGCFAQTITILDLNDEKIVKKLKVEQGPQTIKKFVHPQFGECLLTQCEDKGPISLLITNKIK